METENHENEINTNNKDWLEVIQPFEFVRGIDSQNKLMGKAKDKKDNEYFIYPAPCDIPTCYCWATAEEKERTI